MFRESVLVAAIVLVCCTPSSASAKSHRADPIAVVHAPAKHEPSHDASGVCPIASLLCAGGALATGAVGAAGDVIGAGAKAAADSAMGGVVSWAADGAAWLLGQIAGVVDRSTRPALDSEWYRRDYGAMAELAIALSAVFLLLAAGHAVLRQDLVALLRAAVVALPLAMLLTFAALTLVQLGLALTDWMTASVLSSAGNDSADAFRGIGDVFTAATPGSPSLAPFVVFLTAVLTAVLALVVWVELVLREAAIYVAVAFMPLTFVAMVWRPTAVWCRRLAEGLVAIVLSKFAVAVAFTLAAGALGHARSEPSGGGLTAVLGGCGVLLIAALSPWVLLRLLPLTQSAPDQGLSRQQVGGAVRAAPGATTASGAARLLMFSHFGGAGALAMRPAARPPVASGARRMDASGPPDLPVAKIPDAPKDRPDVRC